MFWNWNWSQRILLAVGSALVALILYPVFTRPRESCVRTPNGTCVSNLKQIGLGLLQYTHDYDEKMPLVRTGGEFYGWADAIQPYLKAEQPFQCPSEANAPPRTPRQNGYIDYFLNRNLEGLNRARVEDFPYLVMAGEGTDGRDSTDARYARASFPAAWGQDQNSPLHRHASNDWWQKSYWSNVLFFDGHVKAQQPEEARQLPFVPSLSK